MKKLILHIQGQWTTRLCDTIMMLLQVIGIVWLWWFYERNDCDGSCQWACHAASYLLYTLPAKGLSTLRVSVTAPALLVKCSKIDQTRTRYKKLLKRFLFVSYITVKTWAKLLDSKKMRIVSSFVVIITAAIKLVRVLVRYMQWSICYID